MTEYMTQEKPRVLIAEKDHIVAADLQHLFRNWGFDDPMVTTDMDTLFSRKRTEQYDIVVIDQNCHDSSNWFHTVRRIFREYRSIVVFLSDFFYVQLPENIMAEKSFYLLPKPFNYNELQNIAESTLKRAYT